PEATRSSSPRARLRAWMAAMSRGASEATMTKLPPAAPPMRAGGAMTATWANRSRRVATSARANPRRG
ncbi:MAG: hypothetical protein ACRD0K_27165, partial [Egibacteraceae bacterium]